MSGFYYGAIFALNVMFDMFVLLTIGRVIIASLGNRKKALFTIVNVTGLFLALLGITLIAYNLFYKHEHASYSMIALFVSAGLSLFSFAIIILIPALRCLNPSVPFSTGFRKIVVNGAFKEVAFSIFLILLSLVMFFSARLWLNTI